MSLFLHLSLSLSHHGFFGVHFLWGRGGHFLNDWSDVGGPVQLDLREAILIGLHHTLDPCNTHTHGLLLLPFFCLLPDPGEPKVLILAKASAKMNQSLCMWPRCEVTEHFVQNIPVLSSQTQDVTCARAHTHTPSRRERQLCGERSTEAHFTHTD